MDKRWRNLGVLLVVIVVAFAAYFALMNLAPQGAAYSDSQKASLALLKKNDVNYAEFKVALELFNYTLDGKALSAIESDASASQEMKDLVAFERRQNASYDAFVEFAKKDPAEMCADGVTPEEILLGAQEIVDEMDAYLSGSNSLSIDSGALASSYFEIEDDLDNLYQVCKGIYESETK